MYRKINLLAWLVLGAVLSACATAPPHNPFKIERKEILARVKTVAMMPVAFARKLDRKAEIAARYETLIAAELEQLDFTIVPSATFTAIWDPMVAKVGGFFDPVTGEVDREKYRAVRKLAIRELLDRHGVDAFLQPRVVVVEARWNGNLAIWHGVREAATGRGGFMGALLAPRAYGSIGALSLVVFISDANDETYYVDYGGIQLLHHVAGRGFTDVPEHELFADPKRDEKAVAISLAPLLGKVLPKEPGTFE